MAAGNSIDLDRDPRSIIGVREEYGADKGLAQTLARLEQHVSELTDQTRTEKREKRA